MVLPRRVAFPRMTTLTNLLEIVPLDKPVRAEITVPGSKSITNRALILGALAEGQTTLRGALWSEDTQMMVEALRTLGFEVKLEQDAQEFSNRTITVSGLGGNIPNAGTEEKPLDLFVGNAGTAARFLAAFVCLGRGVYRLHGVPRMHERPQAELFAALQQLGYEVRAENGNGRLPARIIGAGPPLGIQPRFDLGIGKFTGQGARNCSVSIEKSSQFASALLLCARAGGWNVAVEGENAEESAYVRMTVEIIKTFPRAGGSFQIEPDASSGSYFVAAGRLVEHMEYLEYSEQFGVPVSTQLVKPVSVRGWPHSGWQADENFPEVLSPIGALGMGLQLADAAKRDKSFTADSLPYIKNLPISRIRSLGDSIMTAIVLAPFSLDAIQFTDLGRLRVQECERVAALRTELTRCGARVLEEGDTLTVYPSALHGAEIETYNDHRMAMCFAVLGLKIPGVKIRNPACVKKTFPNFFQKLATPPPDGLGARILDAATNRQLTLQELFAE